MTYPTPVQRDGRRPLLDAALAAAARGWHVFPLIPGDKRPAVANWENRATTDPERIRRCWAHAPYNIGIATGPSGLVIVDLDTAKSSQDRPPAKWDRPGIQDGHDVLVALCEDVAGDAELTLASHTVRTASGGTHLYFAAPGDVELRNTAGKLGWKIDTRAHGGYIVGAGSSLTRQATGYRAVVDMTPAPLPGWLLELLRPAPLPPQEPIAVELSSDRRGKWLRAAVDGELQRVANSQAHEHNNALYIAAVALGQLVEGGELGEGEVTAWLAAAALQVGQGDREARRTIASGLKAGARRPRRLAA
ncbi:bifunctional DNA primase/polymerase [Streptomyces solicathayae]|uniref:Bifunctional DNA primase/polymerase n=1 Tax=Streptomyces solicathayae TaxID=3081768 RepID=A0ABZ0LTR1_9ACTN|nr:bifunctional DNA primase/polymerase [Streptomyces sp. HUAS YS2]WOX22725.1 bifunctional DNA primase/polymerase [Streptomyces sp. HUAS YS2]